MINRPMINRLAAILLFAVALDARACAAANTSRDPDPAVEAGREAIDNWIDYPWYDDATDSVAPIDVSPPSDLSWLGPFS